MVLAAPASVGPACRASMGQHQLWLITPREYKDLSARTDGQMTVPWCPWAPPILRSGDGQDAPWTRPWVGG